MLSHPGAPLRQPGRNRGRGRRRSPRRPRSASVAAGGPTDLGSTPRLWPRRSRELGPDSRRRRVVETAMDRHVRRPVGQHHPDHRDRKAADGAREGRGELPGAAHLGHRDPEPGGHGATSTAWGVANRRSKSAASTAAAWGRNVEDPATAVVEHDERAAAGRHRRRPDPRGPRRRGGRRGPRRAPTTGPPPAAAAPSAVDTPRRCRWPRGWSSTTRGIVHGRREPLEVAHRHRRGRRPPRPRRGAGRAPAGPRPARSGSPLGPPRPRRWRRLGRLRPRPASRPATPPSG